MEPKNVGFEDDFPFQRVIFRFHVNFLGGTILKSAEFMILSLFLAYVRTILVT